MSIDDAFAATTAFGPSGDAAAFGRPRTTPADRRGGGVIAGPAIVGTGTALPEFDIDQSTAAAFAQHLGLSQRYNAALSKLYAASGVRRRGSVLLESTANNVDAAAVPQSFYQAAVNAADRGPGTAARMIAYEKFAPSLAAAAAQRALNDAAIDAHNIAELVTVSCSGFAAPGVDIRLFDLLGLQPTTRRTHVGFMGCHGAINGLRAAAALQHQSRRPVLLVAVELCSLHQQFSDHPQQLVANSLFADGSAAVVLDTATADERVSRDSGRQWRHVDSYSRVIPQTADLMSWTIGDNGFEMTLSPAVPHLIEEGLRSWIDSWLADRGLNADAIDHWLVHPGGPRILDACRDALELDDDALADSRHVLGEHGNMSSPTVLFLLQRLIARRQEKQGQWAMMLAFGPGLAVEACLFQRSNTER